MDLTETKRERLFRLKNVPYFDDASTEARRFLPGGPTEMPSVDIVNRFTATTRSRPEVRLEVLSQLRSYTDDRSNTLIGVVSVVAALVIFAVSTLDKTAFLRLDYGNIVIVVITSLAIVTLFALVFWVLDLVLHINRRRGTCVRWLAAYEDALRTERVSVFARLRKR